MDYSSHRCYMRIYCLFKSSEVEEKRQLIKLVLSNPRVNGENIDYEAQKPFDMLLKCADRQDWLPLVDDLRTFSYDLFMVAGIKELIKIAPGFFSGAILKY
jgi:hypothetical protein